jgi:hypothetical protein
MSGDATCGRRGCASMQSYADLTLSAAVGKVLEAMVTQEKSSSM